MRREGKKKKKEKRKKKERFFGEFSNESSNLRVLCFRDLPLVNIITPALSLPLYLPLGLSSPAPPLHASQYFHLAHPIVSNLIPRLFSPTFAASSPLFWASLTHCLLSLHSNYPPLSHSRAVTNLSLPPRAAVPPLAPARTPPFSPLLLRFY